MKGKMSSPMSPAFPAPKMNARLNLPMEKEPTRKISEHNVFRPPAPKKKTADKMYSPLVNAFKIKKG